MKFVMDKKYKSLVSLIIVTFLLIMFFYVGYKHRPITKEISNNQSQISEQKTEVVASDGSLDDNSVSFNSAVAPKAAAAAKAKAGAAKKTASIASNNLAKANNHISSESNSTSQQNSQIARKIILSGDMSIESNNFDAAIKGITSMIQKAGGYIENSNITGIKSEKGNYLENREATYSLRIPSASFEAFMNSIGTIGVVTSKTSTGEDITSQYFDSDARLKSQKIKEARLLDILKKTKSLADVLAVETELENTRYEIENLTGTLKKWDNLVNYSTLTITLTEVTEKKVLVKKPVTLSEKITTSFKDSIKVLVDTLKGSLIVLVAIIPFAIVILLILLIVWRVIKRRPSDKNDTPKS